MVLHREGDRTLVYLDEDRLDIRVQDEISKALSTVGGARAVGPSEVVAPMPGVVVSIPVREGDEVAQGQPVIVVEAMKMQNSLTSSVAGTIKSIKVSPGTSVEKNQVLLTISS